MLFAALSARSGYAQVDDALERRGLHEDRSYFSAAPFEQIDTVTGNVMLTFTDLALPGNGGRQLVFQRIYNSNRSPQDVSRWRFGFPGMVMKIIEQQKDWNRWDSIPDDIRQIIGTTPRFVMADVSDRPTAHINRYNKLTNPGHIPTYRHVRSAQFYEYDREAQDLRMPDGTVAHYEPDGTTQEGRPILTLRNFTDPFGNTVTLGYETSAECEPLGNVIVVTQSIGNDPAREVVLCLNAGGLPKSMKYAGRTWEYDYVNADGTTDIETVNLPEGLTWAFDYDGDLTSVTLPTGGQIQYTYVTRTVVHSQDPENEDLWETLRTLTSRKEVDGTLERGTSTFTIGSDYVDIPSSHGEIITP